MRRGKAHMHRFAILAMLLPLLALLAGSAPRPLFKDATERPLRYRPEGKDFVIVNGTEFFNRPLYGSNTPFRVDAGDRPEFTLYLPGRGGNLRLGIKQGRTARWLKDSAHIVTRYRAAEMVYEIHDSLLGSGSLRLTVLALSQTEGLIAKAVLSGTSGPVELVWAYGGASGERGGRDGDIGTEREPVTQFFQLKPEYCRGNRFEIAENRMLLHSKPADIAGIFPAGSKLQISDAGQWSSWDGLTAAASGKSELPVAIGQFRLRANEPALLALQRVASSGPGLASGPAAYPERPDVRGRADRDSEPLLRAYSVTELPRIFDQAEEHFRKLADSIVIDTPDPFINAAAGAIGDRRGWGLGRTSGCRHAWRGGLARSPAGLARCLCARCARLARSHAQAPRLLDCPAEHFSNRSRQLFWTRSRQQSFQERKRNPQQR